jgi:hypothetical protein
MKNKTNKIAGSWESHTLKNLEKSFRDKLCNQYSGDELEYRIAFEMMVIFLTRNFSEDIPSFMKGLSDAQLGMLPIISKSQTFVDSDRFIALINLESQSRSTSAMLKLTEKLNCYTIALVMLTVILVFIGIIQIFKM